MKILTYEFNNLPLFERGESFDEITSIIHGFITKDNGVSKYSIRWDDDSEFVVFSYVIANIVFEKESVVFFHEFGVWPGSENTFLFDLVMKGLLGEGIPYREKSILCDKWDEARTVLQLGLESGWGGIIMSSPRSFFYFDHDSRGLIKSSKPVLELMKGLAKTRVFAS
jgi:hypothetical protein